MAYDLTRPRVGENRPHWNRLNRLFFQRRLCFHENKLADRAATIQLDRDFSQILKLKRETAPPRGMYVGGGGYLKTCSSETRARQHKGTQVWWKLQEFEGGAKGKLVRVQSNRLSEGKRKLFLKLQNFICVKKTRVNQRILRLFGQYELRSQRKIYRAVFDLTLGVEKRLNLQVLGFKYPIPNCGSRENTHTPPFDRLWHWRRISLASIAFWTSSLRTLTPRSFLSGGGHSIKLSSFSGENI